MFDRQRKTVRSRRRAADRRRERRLGAEIVELAFALPVMTVIVFGTLETCELMFLKQSLSVASYEAGRVAARPDSTSAEVHTRFQQIMIGRRVNNATMTITPTSIAGLAVGDTIRIDASAPVSGNNSTNLVLTATPDVVESATFVRE